MQPQPAAAPPSSPVSKPGDQRHRHRRHRMDCQMPVMDGFQATPKTARPEKPAPRTDYRSNRQRDGGRTRALPRCGDGRLPGKARAPERSDCQAAAMAGMGIERRSGGSGRSAGSPNTCVHSMRPLSPYGEIKGCRAKVVRFHTAEVPGDDDTDSGTPFRIDRAAGGAAGIGGRSQRKRIFLDHCAGRAGDDRRIR